MPYYIGDLKRDPNSENYPYVWGVGSGLLGFGVRILLWSRTFSGG